MSIFSKKYRAQLLPGQKHAFEDTDPEFIQIFESFAFDEVVNQGDLDDHTRFLAILAALMGCQGADAFCAMVPGALKSGVTPVEMKELVYQGAAYLGLGRVLPFLHGVDAVLEEHGVEIVIVAIPTDNAAGVMKRLEKTHIKGVWNFAHIDYDMPEGIVMESVHLSESLMILNYKIANAEGAGRK